MTDDRVARAVALLDEMECPLTWADVEARLADAAVPVGSPTGWRRRAAFAVAVLVGVGLVALGLVTVLSGSSPDSSVTRTGPDPTDRPGTSEPPGTAVDSPDRGPTTTAPATRTLRTFPVTAFTGAEYLVWGGEAAANDESRRADGFAVEVGNGAVRSIPGAPIDPRSGATGVWTGTELIVCCGTGRADGYPVDTRSAAAWDPATGQWRTLARPPASVARSYPASVWTGEVMVVMARGPAVATYDPATDHWAEVAAPPAIDRLPEAVWTGDEIILWDRRFGSGRVPPDGAVADRGWRWAPGRSAWEPLPDLPPGARTELASIAWSGDEVVVWGESTAAEGEGVGARWRPGDDHWRPVAPSPQGPIGSFDGTPGSQALAADADGGQVLVRALQDGVADHPEPVFAYDPGGDTWTRTDLVIEGYHPVFHVAAGVVVVPDEAAPIAGGAPR
ncbi:MAG: hypothetical protein ACLFWR_10330 [Acidimicrobiales bacterium]